MRITVEASPAMVQELVNYAAHHGVPVPMLVGRAITEYMLDVESGLCGLPEAVRGSVGPALPHRGPGRPRRALA